MTTRPCKLPLRAVFCLCAAIACLAGCNTNPTRSTTGTDWRFSLTAILDPIRNVRTSVATLSRADTAMTDAVITLDGDTLIFDRPTYPDVYSRYDIGAASFDANPVRLLFADTFSSTSFIAETLQYSTPGTFSVLGIEPPNRISTGLGAVSVDWGSSSAAAGYVLAAVRRNMIYTDTGYSSYVTSQATAGTIPPEAFSLSPGPDPDTGWYYLFVYSYTGRPDSALTSLLLPVPFPSQLADNIADGDLTGTAGIVRVAWWDSVHVVTNP